MKLTHGDIQQGSRCIAALAVQQPALLWRARSAASSRASTRLHGPVGTAMALWLGRRLRATVWTFLLTVLGGYAASAAAEDWKLRRQADGVTVSTQPAPGFSLSASRAETRVPVAVDAVLALLSDAPSFPRWYSDCVENRVLAQLSTGERIVYVVTDAPFPVSDRDSIIRTRIAHDAVTQAVTVTMHGQPDYLPPHPGRVRVPRLEGLWTLTPISATETQVTFELRADTGGSVPAFLAERQVTSGPFATMRKLREWVLKPRYRDARVDYDASVVTFGDAVAP